MRCVLLGLTLLSQVGPARAERQACPARPSKLGPFALHAGDGSELELGFAAQLRATVANTGKDLSDAERDTEDTWELRRVRLLLRAALLDDQLKLGVQLSPLPASPELLDLWADASFDPALRVRVGQFKTPLTRYRWQSFAKLELVDWPVAAKHFGSERQLGAMLHNGQKDEGPWSYALGVFTGQNARASFATGIAEAYAEPLHSPSSLRDPAAPSGAHPEVVARVSHNSPDIQAETNSDETGGPLRYSLGLSAAWDLAAVETQDFTERLAPEVLLKLGGVSLNLVGYLGAFRPESEPLRISSWGATAEAAWRMCPMWEVAARYSRVNTTRWLRQAARDHAALRVAEAAVEDQATVADAYASAGTVQAHQEVLLGLNGYFAGSSLKWQTDAGWLRRKSDARPREDIVVRSQLQLAF